MKRFCEHLETSPHADGSTAKGDRVRTIHGRMPDKSLRIHDCHMHTWGNGKPLSPAEFLDRTSSCGVVGGNIFSVHPATRSSQRTIVVDQRNGARMDAVLGFTSQTPGFLPFYYLNPTEKDAVRQVEEAGKCGIRGFKIIVGMYHIGDYLDPLCAAAEANLPVMFHCGMCSDPDPASQYSRPIEFESLLAVPGLKFSLAHLGWPWYDEFMGTVAKYHFNQKIRDDGKPMAKMYIDLTPGTPGIYRRESLRHLYLTGYPVTEITMWGNDLGIENYETQYARWHLERDGGILSEIEDDYRSGRVDRRWLPDLTDIQTPAFEKAWYDFVGEPLPQDDV